MSGRCGRMALKGHALRMWRAILAAVVLIPLFGTAAAVISAVLWGLEPRHLGLFAALYLITALGVTAGYHRLFAHHRR